MFKKNTRKLFEKTIGKIFIPRIKGVSIDNIEILDEELIFPSDMFRLPEKLDVFGQKHTCFTNYTCEIPPFYVRSVKNAKCVVGREEIFTCNDEVIIEYTSQKVNPYIGGDKRKISKPYKINGSVANLSLSGLENNYFHWLTECLARYYLLEKSKFKPDFYLLSNGLSFQKQYLEILKIDKKRIIDLESNLVIQADDIIIPSFINNWEPINFRGYSSYQKQWLPSWIGNIYQENINFSKPRENKSKIYISRAFADYRKIKNEDEIIDFLSSKGYKTYHLENMLVNEQVELFSNASIVIGVHGAGFSNIYFCPQSTIVFELFSEYYHDSSFKVLSNALGLKYHYMIGKTNNIESVHPQKENFHIDLAQLEMAIDILDLDT
jgi:hypothetical protein